MGKNENSGNVIFYHNGGKGIDFTIYDEDSIMNVIESHFPNVENKMKEKGLL